MDNRHRTDRPPLGVDALGPLVNLQPLLRHLGIPEELQRHPDKVSLDLLQLLSHLVRRDHAVKDVARLDALGRHEAVVVVKRFDYGI
jgi:hypothetical protein